MTFVFYDTETTGLDSAFDQILQFAAIVTDDDFNAIEELNLRCRLQPHVVPSPGAMFVTRVGPRAIQSVPLSFYEIISAVRKFIERWTPAIFIGFNSIGFDEKMLRGAFYQTLHPPYLTNTNGNSRMDVLRLAHAVAEHRPDAINVPLNEKGKANFKLGRLAEANNLSLDQAHDALADTRATIALARILRDRAPEIWESLYACRSRHSVDALLKDNALVLLTDRAFAKPTILAGLITPHSENPSALAMFDLAYDPALYLDVDSNRAQQLLKASPRPIRIVRTNALPIICPIHVNGKFGIELAVAHERLERIRVHPTFASVIGKAMSAQYENAIPPIHVEQQLYDGFPSAADGRRMEQFHRTLWIGRYELLQGFEDERFRELAERVVYNEHPELLPPDRRVALDGWRRKRMGTDGEVPWLSLAAARGELDQLRATAGPVDTALIAEIDQFFAGLSAECLP